MLTVYRSGMINLNGEATRLMHDRHEEADLLPPAKARQGWQLDRRDGAACELLKGGREGSHLRFYAPLRAAELFRDQPASVKRIVFRLTPNTHRLDLYTLAAELPISNATPILQQKG